MDPTQIQTGLIVACMVAFFGWRHFRFLAVKKKLPALLESGGVVVDVRSPAEFATGARQGSLNIPLPSLAAQLGKLNREKPVIVCCASGSRSGMAAGLLKRNGFAHVFNAGPWRNTL